MPKQSAAEIQQTLDKLRLVLQELTTPDAEIPAPISERILEIPSIFTQIEASFNTHFKRLEEQENVQEKLSHIKQQFQFFLHESRPLLELLEDKIKQSQQTLITSSPRDTRSLLERTLIAPIENDLEILYHQTQAMILEMESNLRVSGLLFGGKPLILSTDIRERLENIATFYHKRLLEKEIQLNLYVDSSAPALIEIDPHIFHHIVSNLLSNAIKYSPEQSGPISIHCSTNILNNDQCRINVTVKDQGYGMPDDYIPFQWDKQAGNVTERGRIEGHGVGLAAIYELSKLLGNVEGNTKTGKLSHVSQLGVGTTMILSFVCPITPKQKNSIPPINIQKICDSFSLTQSPKPEAEPKSSPYGDHGYPLLFPGSFSDDDLTSGSESDITQGFGSLSMSPPDSLCISLPNPQPGSQPNSRPGSQPASSVTSPRDNDTQKASSSLLFNNHQLRRPRAISSSAHLSQNTQSMDHSTSGLFKSHSNDNEAAQIDYPPNPDFKKQASAPILLLGPKSPRQTFKTKGLHFLLIDDEILALKTQEKTIKDMGGTVTIIPINHLKKGATNQDIANLILAHIQAFSYDFILIDHSLGSTLDGVEIAKILSKPTISTTPTPLPPPVLLVTAGFESRNEQEKTDIQRKAPCIRDIVRKGVRTFGPELRDCVDTLCPLPIPKSFSPKKTPTLLSPVSPVSPVGPMNDIPPTNKIEATLGSNSWDTKAARSRALRPMSYIPKK